MAGRHQKQPRSIKMIKKDINFIEFGASVGYPQDTNKKKIRAYSFITHLGELKNSIGTYSILNHDEQGMNPNTEQGFDNLCKKFDGKGLFPEEITEPIYFVVKRQGRFWRGDKTLKNLRRDFDISQEDSEQLSKNMLYVAAIYLQGVSDPVTIYGEKACALQRHRNIASRVMDILTEPNPIKENRGDESPLDDSSSFLI
tara:strand:- start:1093 stop:1689 length:597 start_codon:yes stop_codon:yes gene_type:complete